MEKLKIFKFQQNAQDCVIEEAYAQWYKEEDPDVRRVTTLSFSEQCEGWLLVFYTNEHGHRRG